MPSAEHSELLVVLQSFGFSHHQSRVYLDLLALGSTTAGPLVRKTGLHRQYVYSALEVLEEQRFASHLIRNGRKVFTAARPEALLEREADRMRKLQLAIPKLQQLVPSANSKLHIEVLTGREEFIRRLFAAVDSAARTDKLIRIIADARDVDIYAHLGKDYLEYVKYCKEKKVRKRLIAPAGSASDAYQERLVKEPKSELRVSLTGAPAPTATIITPELVILDIFAHEVVSVLVWNASVATSFIKHFDVLWKSSVSWSAYLEHAALAKPVAKKAAARGSSRSGR